MLMIIVVYVVLGKVVTSVGVSTDTSVVKGTGLSLPSVDQAAAYLSLPAAAESRGLEGRASTSPHDLLGKLRSYQEDRGADLSIIPEFRAFEGSSLVLLTELNPLEERLRQYRDTNNPKWQELETNLNYLRQGLSTQISRILNEYESGKEPSPELLKDISKELEGLRKESRLVEESSRGERESTEMEKGFDGEKILKSLGYDVASLSEEEKSELEFKLALGREEVGIELEKAQAALRVVEEERNGQIEYLTKETGKTVGHFFGFLFGEYDLGNKGMKLNLERLAKTQSEVMQAQQALASVNAESDKLNIALSVFQAERSWSEGRYEEAHRSILRVMESSQRDVVIGENKNLVLKEATFTSYRILSEEGRLSEREKVILSDKEGDSKLLKATVDYHRETTKGDVGVDLDARDQVVKRSSWSVEEESKVSEKFKAVTLNYNNRPHKELNDLEFVGLRSGSGVRYDLVLTGEAKSALENIPEGAVPVFLKPVKSMQSNYAGGRQRSVILANPPSDFRVEDYQVGYELNGKFYQSGGAEIDLSKHPHADWIRGQVSRASSFKVSEFRAGNSVDLKKYNVGTGKLEKYNEKLHILETESGEKIEGVKLDKEVLELIRKVPPEGYTLVLKNKPESLMLGALDRENYSVGRGVRVNQSRRIMGEVPELGVEDFEYAKVSEDKLERVTIDQTPIRESNLTGLRQLDQTATRDIQRALANDEDVKWLRSGALSTNRTLSNLQGFLQANQEGSSREAFIEFARSEAKPLEEFLTSGDTKEKIERLEGKLSELKKLSKGVAGSEYEREILDQIKAIESFIAVVKDPRTLEVVKTIGDASKFGEDSWNRWASTELPIIAASVAGAVAASAVVVASAGTMAPVVVPLWVTAAAGAVGGVVGGELAQEGLHFYETSYGGASRGEYTWSRRSLLAQVGDKTFNHETGKYEDITLGNVSLEYGKQVTTNFLFSYGSMLGSQALSAKFTEILTKSNLVEKVMENSTTGKLLARYLGSKTASTMSQAERLTIEKAFKEAGRQMAREFPDEISDELLEDWTGKLIDKVGQNLSKAGVNIGQDHLAGLIVGTVKGTRVSSRSFAYDNSNIASGKQAEGLTELINKARESGYVITNLGGGHYTFADTVNGERYTVRPKTDEDTAVFSAPQIDMMLQIQRPAVEATSAEVETKDEEIKEVALPKPELAKVEDDEKKAVVLPKVEETRSKEESLRTPAVREEGKEETTARIPAGFDKTKFNEQIEELASVEEVRDRYRAIRQLELSEMGYTEDAAREEAIKDSRIVNAFFDPASEKIVIAEGYNEATLRLSRIAGLSDLIHEIGHATDGDSLATIREKEIKAYTEQAEYLAKNGYQMVFNKRGTGWKVCEVPDAFLGDVNLRRDRLVKQSEEQVSKVVREGLRYLDRFIAKNYPEVKVINQTQTQDGALAPTSRLISAVKGGQEIERNTKELINNLKSLVSQGNGDTGQNLWLRYVVSTLPSADLKDLGLDRDLYRERARIDLLSRYGSTLGSENVKLISKENLEANSTLTQYCKTLDDSYNSIRRRVVELKRDRSTLGAINLLRINKLDREIGALESEAENILHVRNLISSRLTDMSNLYSQIVEGLRLEYRAERRVFPLEVSHRLREETEDRPLLDLGPDPRKDRRNTPHKNTFTQVPFLNLDNLKMFANEDIVNILYATSDSGGQARESVKISDLELGENKLRINTDSNVEVTQVIDDRTSERKHILTQGNPYSYESSSLSMLAMDYIVNNPEDVEVLSTNKSALGRIFEVIRRVVKKPASRPYVNRLLEAIATGNSGGIEYKIKEANTLLESKNAEIKALVNVPAVDITAGELERMLSTYGSLVITGAGYAVILDSIYFDSQNKAGVARIRDPFHGWMIDVTLPSFLNRLQHPQTIAYISDSRTKASAEQEFDYSKIQIDGSDKIITKLLGVINDIKKEHLQRGLEPKRLNELFVALRDVVDSSRMEFLNFQDELKEEPFSEEQLADYKILSTETVDKLHDDLKKLMYDTGEELELVRGQRIRLLELFSSMKKDFNTSYDSKISRWESNGRWKRFSPEEQAARINTEYLKLKESHYRPPPSQLKASREHEWREGEARTPGRRNPKSSPINYLPTRAAFENEFVSQERESARLRNEEFNEERSTQRAKETFAFFSRLNDQIYSLTPETLQGREKGELGPDRDTRIMQAMAVVHELTHKRLNKPNPAKNEEMALGQEIEVWKECALYLKARGYEFRFGEDGGWRIVQFLTEKESIKLSTKRREIERNRKVPAGSLVKLEHLEVEAIREFVRGAYRQEQSLNEFDDIKKKCENLLRTNGVDEIVESISQSSLNPKEKERLSESLIITCLYPWINGEIKLDTAKALIEKLHLSEKCIQASLMRGIINNLTPSPLGKYFPNNALAIVQAFDLAKYDLQNSELTEVLVSTLMRNSHQVKWYKENTLDPSQSMQIKALIELLNSLGSYREVLLKDVLKTYIRAFSDTGIEWEDGNVTRARAFISAFEIPIELMERALLDAIPEMIAVSDDPNEQESKIFSLNVLKLIKALDLIKPREGFYLRPEFQELAKTALLNSLILQEKYAWEFGSDYFLYKPFYVDTWFRPSSEVKNSIEIQEAVGKAVLRAISEVSKYFSEYDLNCLFSLLAKFAIDVEGDCQDAVQSLILKVLDEPYDSEGKSLLTLVLPGFEQLKLKESFILSPAYQQALLLCMKKHAELLNPRAIDAHVRDVADSSFLIFKETLKANKETLDLFAEFLLTDRSDTTEPPGLTPKPQICLPQGYLEVSQERLRKYFKLSSNQSFSECRRVLEIFHCVSYFESEIQRINSFANPSLEERRLAINFITLLAQYEPRDTEKSRERYNRLVNDLLSEIKPGNEELADVIESRFVELANQNSELVQISRESLRGLLSRSEVIPLSMAEQVHLNVIASINSDLGNRILLQVIAGERLPVDDRKEILNKLLKTNLFGKNEAFKRRLVSTFIESDSKVAWRNLNYIIEVGNISNSRTRETAQLELENFTGYLGDANYEDIRARYGESIPVNAFPAIYNFVWEHAWKNWSGNGKEAELVAVLSNISKLYEACDSSTLKADFLTSLCALTCSSSLSKEYAYETILATISDGDVVNLLDLNDVNKLVKSVLFADKYHAIRRDSNLFERGQLVWGATNILKERVCAELGTLLGGVHFTPEHIEALDQGWGDIEPILTYAGTQQDYRIRRYLGELVLNMDPPKYEKWKAFRYELAKEKSNRSLHFLKDSQLEAWMENQFLELSDMKLVIASGDIAEGVFKDMYRSIVEHQHLESTNPYLQERLSGYLMEMNGKSEEVRRKIIAAKISEIENERIELGVYLKGVEAGEVDSIVTSTFKEGAKVKLNAKTRATLLKVASLLSADERGALIRNYQEVEKSLEEGSNKVVDVDLIINLSARENLQKEILRRRHEFELLDTEAFFERHGFTKESTNLIGARSVELESLINLLKLCGLNKTEIAKGRLADVNEVKDSGVKLVDLVKDIERKLKLNIQEKDTEIYRSPFRQDIVNIAFALNHQDSTDLDRDRRLAVVFTDDPQILMQIGKYPIGNGSCQNYDHGTHNSSLLGYVGDSHIKALLLIDLDKLPEEIKDRMSKEGFEAVRSSISAQQILEASLARSIAKVVSMEAKADNGAEKKLLYPAVFLEPTYSTVNKGDTSMDKYFNMLTQLTVSDKMGVQLLRGGGDRVVWVSESNNPGGQYEDCAAGNAGHVGMGIQYSKYKMSAKVIQAYDRPTLADENLARRLSQGSYPVAALRGNSDRVYGSWKEGEARTPGRRNPASSPINYFPTREAFENEFVLQERVSAKRKGEVFNESRSRERAKETFAFFSRLNDQIYSLTPETLQATAKGELGPGRDTRIMQAMAVIHELTHKRLDNENPALNEEMALEQEIEVWKECALYLKARGYEFRFDDNGGWRIVQFLTEKESIKLGTKRREIERNRKVPAGSLVQLSDLEIEAINKFVEGSYGKVKPEAEVNGESNGGSQTRSELTNVRDEFEFRETGRFITVHGNVRVPIQALVIEGREYEGHLRNNKTAFYVNESEIPALYAHILRTRDQTDENGSEDVNAFIDKRTGLVFVPMPGENETPEQTEARIAKTSHEIQHRIDLIKGRDLDEGRAYAKARKYTKNEALTTFDENRNKGAESRSLAASRVNVRVLEINDAIEKAFREKNTSSLEKFKNTDLKSIGVVYSSGKLNDLFTGRGLVSAGLPTMKLASAIFKEARIVKIKNRGDDSKIIEREVLEIDVDCAVEGQDGTTLYTMICDPDLKEYDSGEGNDQRYYAKVGKDNYQVRKLRNEIVHAFSKRIPVDLEVAGFLGSELELISIGAVGVGGILNASFTGRGRVSAGLPNNLKSVVFKETRVVKIKNRGDQGTIIEREVLEIDVDCSVEGQDGTTLYTMICDPDLKEYDSGEGNDQRYYAKVGKDNYQVRKLSNEVEYALKNKVLVDLRVAGFLGSELELISIGAVGVNGILNASFTGRGLVSAGLPNSKLKSAVFKETRVVKIKNRGDEGTIIEREVLEIDVDYAVEGQDGTTLYTMICDPDLKEYDSGEGNDQRYYAKVGKDNYQVRKLRNEIVHAFSKRIPVDLEVAGFLRSDLELISIGAVGVSGILNASFTGRGRVSAGLPTSKLKSVVFKETRVVKIKNRGDEGTIIEREVLEIDVDCAVEGQDGTTLYTMICDPDLKEYDSGEGNDQRYYAKVGQDNYQVRKLRNEIEYALKNKVLVDLEVAEFLGSELELISIGASTTSGILNHSFTRRGQVSAGLPNSNLKSAVFKETRIVKIKNRGDDSKIIEREVLEIDVDCSVEGQDGTTLYTMICDPDLKEYDSGEGNDQRYYAKVGKDNYQVRKLSNEVEYALKNKVLVDLRVAGFLGSELELISIGAVGVGGILNASFTGRGLVSAGLPHNLKSVVFKETRVVKIKNRGDEGTIIEREVLEIDVDYAVEGQDGTTLYTMICDPDLKEYDSGEGNDQRYYAKVGQDNYQVRKLRNEIVHAFSKRIPVDLEVAGFLGSDLELISIGAVGVSGILNASFTGMGRVTAGLPRIVKSFKVLGSKFRDGVLELRILYERENGARGVRYLGFDGENFFKVEKGITSISTIKGDVLDILLFLYVMKSQGQGSQYRKRFVVSEFTGEVREPNIVLNDGSWLHAKWGPASQSVEYLNMLLRASQVVGDRGATPLEFLIYRDNVAEIVESYGNALCGKTKLGSEGLKVRSVLDYVLENGLGQAEKDLLNQLGEVEDLSEDELSLRTEELQREVQSFKNEGPGQIDLSRKEAWQQHVDGYLNNYSLLKEEFEKLLKNHSPYWNDRYHFHLVAYSAYVLKRLGDSDVDFADQQKKDIREVIYTLYSDLGVVEDLDRLIEVMCLADQGAAFEREEGAENVGEARRAIEPRKFKLGDYLELSTDTVDDRIIAGGDAGNIGVGFSKRHSISTLSIAGNLNSYLSNVLTRLGKEESLSEDSKSEIRLSICSRIERHLKEFRSDEFSSSDPREKGSYESLSIEQLEKVLASLELRDESQKLKEISRILLDEGGETLFTAKQVAQLKSHSNQEISNLWREGEARTPEHLNPKSSPINYLPTRESFEDEFVLQERRSADAKREVFDEAKSRQRARETFAFFSRLNDQIYSLTPETLQVRAKGALGPDRDTRIMQAMAVIHELTHKRLNKANPALNEEMALEQEIEVWKECALYLKARGYIFEFDDSGGWRIVQFLTERESHKIGTKRREIERNRKVPAGSLVKLSVVEIEAISNFVRSNYEDISLGVAQIAGKVTKKTKVESGPLVAMSVWDMSRLKHQNEMTVFMEDTPQVTKGPEYKSMQRIADNLRQAAKQDTVLDVLGVELSSNLKLYLMDNPGFDAFVSPVVQDTVFISLGALDELKSKKMRIGVAGHEQGHQISDHLLEKEYFEIEKAREKGRVELSTMQFQDEIRALRDRLTSVRQEIFADTHGSLYYLSTQGVGYQDAISLQAVFARMEPPENELKQDITTLSILKTHPTSRDRIEKISLVGSKLDFPLKRDLGQVVKQDSPRVLESPVESLVMKLRKFLSRHMELDSLLIGMLNSDPSGRDLFLKPIRSEVFTAKLNALSIDDLIAINTIFEAITDFVYEAGLKSSYLAQLLISDCEDPKSNPPTNRNILPDDSPSKGREEVHSETYINQVKGLIDGVIKEKLNDEDNCLYRSETLPDLTPEKLLRLGKSRLEVKDIGPSFLASIIRDLPLASVYAKEDSSPRYSEIIQEISIGRGSPGSIVLDTKAVNELFYDKIVGDRRRSNLDLVQVSVIRFAMEGAFASSSEFLTWLEKLRDEYNSSSSNLLPNLNNQDIGKLIFSFAINTSNSAIRDELLDYLSEKLHPDYVDLDFVHGFLVSLKGELKDSGTFQDLFNSIHSRFPKVGDHYLKRAFNASLIKGFALSEEVREFSSKYDAISVSPIMVDRVELLKSLCDRSQHLAPNYFSATLKAELPSILTLTDPMFSLDLGHSKLFQKKEVNLHEEYSIEPSGEVSITYQRVDAEPFSDYLMRLEKLPNRFSAEHWLKLISEDLSSVENLEEFFNLVDRIYVDSKHGSEWTRTTKDDIKLKCVNYFLDWVAKEEVVLSTSDLEGLRICVNSTFKSESRNETVIRLIESFKHLDADFVRPLLGDIHFGDFSEQMYHRVSEIKVQSDEDWIEFEAGVNGPTGLYFSPVNDLSKQFPVVREDFDNSEKYYRNLGYIKCLKIRELHEISSELRDFLLKEESLGSYATVEGYRFGVLKYLTQKNGVPQNAIEMDSEIIRRYEACIRSFKDFRDPLSDVSWMPISSTDVDQRISYLCSLSPQATETRDQWLVKAFETAKEKGIKISDEVLQRLKAAMLIESNKNLVAESLWENYLGTHDLREFGVLPALKELRSLFPNYCDERNKAITQIRQYSKSHADGRLMQMLWWDPGLPKAIPSIRNLSMDATLQFQSEILRMLDDYEQLEVLLYLMGIYTREEKGWVVDYIESGLRGTLEHFRSSNRGLNSTDRREFLHSVFGGRNGLLARNDASAMRHLSHILTAVLLEGLPAESRNEATRNKINSIVTAIFTNKSLPIYFKVEILDSLYAWLLKTENSKDAIDSDEVVANLIKSVFSSIGGIGDRILQGLLVEPKLIPEGVKKHLREAQDKREFSSILAPFHALIKDGYEQVVLGRPIACGSIGEVHEVKSLDGIEVKDLLAKTVRPETLAWLAIIETPLREICSVIGTHFDGWSDTPLNKIFESCRAEITAFEKEEARTGKFMADLLQKSLGGVVIQSPNGNYEIVRGDKLPNVLIPTAITDMKRSRESDPSEGEYQRSMLIRDLGPNFKSMASIDRERGEKSLKAHLKDEYGVELSDVANVAVSSFFGTFILSDAVMEDMHFGNVGIIAEKGQKPRIVMLDFGGFLESFPKNEKDLIFSICKHIFMGDDDGLKRDLYRVVFNSGDLDQKKMPERAIVIDSVVEGIKTLRESGKPVEPVKVVEDVLASIYSGLSVSSELRTFCESLRKIAREWIPHVTGDELFGLSMQMMQEIVNLNSSEGGKVDSDAPLSNTLEAFEKLVLQHQARFKDVGVVFGKVLEEFRGNESYNELSLIVKDLLSDDNVISGLDSVLSKSSVEIREVIDKLRLKAKTEDARTLQGSLKASFDEIVTLVNSEKVEIADFFKFVRLIVGDVSELDGSVFESYQLRLKDFYAENSSLFTKSLRTILSTTEFRAIFSDLLKDNEEDDFIEWFNIQNKANLGPEETYQDVSKDAIQMARNYYEAIGDRIDKGTIIWMQVEGEWKQYELANDYNIGAKNLNVFLKSAPSSSRKTIDLPVKSSRQAYFEITIDDVCYKFSLSGLFQLIEGGI